LTIKSTSHTRLMTPVYFPDFQPNDERYFLICAYLCRQQSSLQAGLPAVMPVKYSVVKDLDCVNNRQTPTMKVCGLLRREGRRPKSPPTSVRCSRGQLDAETRRPAPGRWEELS
jgi:hypothetical protein